MSMQKKQNPQIEEIIVTLFIFLPLVEARYIALHISEAYMFFFALWFVLSLYFRFSSQVTFSLSINSLLFSLFALFVGNNFFATRLAMWFYLFFSDALLLQLIERIGHRKSNAFVLSHLKAIQLVTISPISAFLTVMQYIIYRSKILLFIFLSAWISLIINQMLDQAKYFFWFFYFNKLQHFIFQTFMFEFVIALIVFAFFVRLALWAIDVRLLFAFYSVTIFFCNSIIFFVTTRNITIQGDIPIIAEVKKEDGFVQLWGHNFRRWPNQASSIYLNGYRQDIVYWSDVLIVFKPSEQSEHSYIWLISPLEFTSKKYRVNLKE